MSNETGLLQVYKGSCYQKIYQKKYQKIIVLDLDETIGSFGDLYILWTALNKIRALDKNETQTIFDILMDMYPEFLRYGILNILEFLYFKKASGQCDKLFIYTNNICTPPWVSLIVSYINKRLKTSNCLFDKIISAFKINNKIVEFLRTSKDKNCGDLIRCTLLPKTTEICFIDDTYHRDMINEKVYYIQPFPYFHGLSVDVIIKRFMLSSYGVEFMKKTNMMHTFEEYISDWFFFHHKGRDDVASTKDVDVFVAQKMMYHIKDFFYLTNRKNRTCKKRASNHRKTHKNRLSVDSSLNQLS